MTKNKVIFCFVVIAITLSCSIVVFGKLSHPLNPHTFTGAKITVPAFRRVMDRHTTYIQAVNDFYWPYTRESQAYIWTEQVIEAHIRSIWADWSPEKTEEVRQLYYQGLDTGIKIQVTLVGEPEGMEDLANILMNPEDALKYDIVRVALETNAGFEVKARRIFLESMRERQDGLLVSEASVWFPSKNIHGSDLITPYTEWLKLWFIFSPELQMYFHFEFDEYTGPDRQATSPTSSTPQRSSGWSVVNSWSGSGSRTTDIFRIPNNRWRITWTTRNETFQGAGLLQIFVYDSDNNPVDLAANQLGLGNGESFVHKAGTFYLQILSGNVDYDIKVEIPNN